MVGVEKGLQKEETAIKLARHFNFLGLETTVGEDNSITVNAPGGAAVSMDELVDIAHKECKSILKADGCYSSDPTDNHHRVAQAVRYLAELEFPFV